MLQKNLNAENHKDAKEEWQNQVDELDKQLTVAQDKLKEVKNATAENWKEVKSGVEVAFDDLGKSFALLHFPNIW